LAIEVVIDEDVNVDDEAAVDK
jgi:hypothetical protein